MIKKSKRILAALISISMLAGVFAATAIAEEPVPVTLPRASTSSVIYVKQEQKASDKGGNWYNDIVGNASIKSKTTTSSYEFDITVPAKVPAETKLKTGDTGYTALNTINGIAGAPNTETTDTRVIAFRMTIPAGATKVSLKRNDVDVDGTNIYCETAELDPKRLYPCKNDGTLPTVADMDHDGGGDITATKVVLYIPIAYTEDSGTTWTIGKEPEDAKRKFEVEFKNTEDAVVGSAIVNAKVLYPPAVTPEAPEAPGICWYDALLDDTTPLNVTYTGSDAAVTVNVKHPQNTVIKDGDAGYEQLNTVNNTGNGKNPATNRPLGFHLDIPAGAKHVSITPDNGSSGDPGELLSSMYMLTNNGYEPIAPDADIPVEATDMVLYASFATTSNFNVDKPDWKLTGTSRTFTVTYTYADDSTSVHKIAIKMNYTKAPVAVTEIKVKNNPTLAAQASGEYNINALLNASLVPETTDKTIADIVWSICDDPAHSTTATGATVKNSNTLKVGSVAGTVALKGVLTNTVSLTPATVTVHASVNVTLPKAQVTVNVGNTAGESTVYALFVPDKGLPNTYTAFDVKASDAAARTKELPVGVYLLLVANCDNTSSGFLTNYNSATKSVMKTVKVENSNPITVDVSLPEKNINIQQAPVTPNDAVAADRIISDNTQNIVNPEELNTQQVKIVITPTLSAPSDNPDPDEEAINEKLSSEKTPLAALDINITQSVNSATPEPVTETFKPLRFTIALAESLRGQGPFEVWRSHENEVTGSYEVEKIAGAECYDAITNTITFSSDKFSLFMLVQGTPSAPPTPSYSHSSSGGGSSSYGTITVPDTVAGGKINEVDRTTFEFKPDAGYTVKDILVDGKSVGKGFKYRFTDGKDHKLTVIFEKIDGKTAPSTNVPQTGVVELLPLF